MSDEKVGRVRANVGSLDRTIRLVLGLTLLLLGLCGMVTGPMAALIRVAAIVALLTGLLRWCPSYVMLDFLRCRAGSGRNGHNDRLGVPRLH